MLAVLPILAFLNTFFILRSVQRLCWRGALMTAAIGWGVWLTCMTEFLSALNSLARWSLVVAWGSTIVGMGGYLLFFRRRSITFRVRWPASRFERFALIGLLFFVLTLALIAWVAPPNTWDSMTYHMSRVVHWIQNKSVAYYPTHIPRQLHQSPWSEYAITHFQLLAGSDRLANYIQWAGMVGSLVGVSLLAKTLGANARGQMLAAVVCATIPMGILQATSTQTDYVLSFWLTCFVYFGVRLQKQPSWGDAGFAGAALGLAVLTKATAYVYAAPFALWFGLSLLLRFRLKPVLQALVIAGLAIAINGCQYARNFDLYRNVLGPGRESEVYAYATERISLSGLASNMARNVALHLGTPFDPVNQFVEKVIIWLHDRSGVALNDPYTTWSGTTFQRSKISFHEDEAGNLLHTLLFVAAAVLFGLQKPRDLHSSFYFIALCAGFIFFSGYLKWQPWHTRLHLPLFVLGAPWIGWVFSKLKPPGIVGGLALILFLGATPWLIGNASRPIFGENSIFAHSREAQYFRNRPDIAASFLQTADYLTAAGCKRVGLITDIDSWEYPLWVLLRNRLGTGVYFEHVNVENASIEKALQSESEKLCVVVSMDTQPFDGVLVEDLPYYPLYRSGPLRIYSPNRPSW